MTEQPRIPDPETNKRLLANLRRTRLQMEEFGLKLEEITAKLENDIRQKRLARLQRSLAATAPESPPSKQHPL